MLKRMSLKKILVSTLTLVALLLLYIVPSNNTLKDVKQDLEYVVADVIIHPIFLLDSNNYIAKTKVVVKSLDKEELTKEIIEILISNGVGESSIPSGFKSFIPSDTKINNISFDNDIVNIDFSEEFLDIHKSLEEKIVEGLVFSLTEIDGINKVKISIDGKELTFLPKNKKNIPSILDRSFGINKDYEISSNKDISSVTLYYINKYNDDFYYVPVTKYLNDNHEKIEIIIEQLKNPVFNSNLMSFINENTKLESYEFNDKSLKLVFNDDIFSDFEEKEILEEVIYTIAMSIEDNYNVCNVIFNVGNEEIKKSTLKSIDCD